MSTNIDDIFAFGAQQQVDCYNRIAGYKEKEAAHAMLVAKIMHENAQLSLKHTQQALRPTMMLRPELTREGDMWIASYHDVRGTGPTPDIACQDFDAIWTGRKEDM